MQTQRNKGGGSSNDWIKNWKQKSDNIDSYLSYNYYNTKNTASYRGVDKLYNFVKKIQIKIFQKEKLGNGLVNKRPTHCIEQSGSDLKVQEYLPSHKLPV